MPMKKLLRKLWFHLPTALGVYLVILALLYGFQRKLMFHPKSLSAGRVFHFGAPFREYDIPVNDYDKLNAVWLEADSARGLVLYFHGNKGNLQRDSARVQPFLRARYDVLMMDYPGYGKSTGSSSEEDFYRSAKLVYQLARQHMGSDSIVIYGRSLGGAVAAELASHQPCRALVLESPFYSMDAMARHYFPIFPVGPFLAYHFPVHRFLAKVYCPVVIFHGDEDRLVPLRQSRRLEPLLKRGDRFVVLPGAGHQDIYKHPGYIQTLDSLLLR